MSKKSVSQKRALRKQEERAALGNIFNVFLAGLSAECVLFLIYRCYLGGSVDSFLAWHNILEVLVWVALAVFAAGIGIAFVKKNDAKIRKTCLIVGFSGLFLSAVSFISTRFRGNGLTGLCVVVPLVTVLGLVYFLYQRECFLSTTLLAGTLFTNWVCGKGLGSYWNTLVVIGALAVVAGIVAVLVLLTALKKNDGELRNIRFFAPGSDYRIPFAACLVCIAAILLTVFVPSLSFYLTWALVIAVFAELAYYTTKMM